MPTINKKRLGAVLSALAMAVVLAAGASLFDKWILTPYKDDELSYNQMRFVEVKYGKSISQLLPEIQASCKVFADSEIAKRKASREAIYKKMGIPQGVDRELEGLYDNLFSSCTMKSSPINYWTMNSLSRYGGSAEFRSHIDSKVAVYAGYVLGYLAASVVVSLLFGWLVVIAIPGIVKKVFRWIANFCIWLTTPSK